MYSSPKLAELDERDGAVLGQVAHITLVALHGTGDKQRFESRWIEILGQYQRM